MSTLTYKGFQHYLRLGSSGLRVSPLCLGTMTFGTEWGWGSPEQAARTIFNRYIDLGGNFIDTADMYTMGTSEQLVGKFIKERSLRDRVVLATKFTFSAEKGNPNAGGNHRKNIRRAIEGSLKRMQTEYIDLYWLHVWDLHTPIDEVMATLNALVDEGKIHHIGLSDVPAWYLARAQTLSELRGWEKVCALQLEYSLIERNIEREHIPAARAMNIGLCPWSPLAGGMLSGKYSRSSPQSEEGRLQAMADPKNPFFRFSDRNFDIVETLVKVASEIDKSPAQIALNWACTQPGVSSTIIGATKMSQLEDNLQCLDFEIPQELRRRLDEVSRPAAIFPYTFFQPGMQEGVHGGTEIREI